MKKLLITAAVSALAFAAPAAAQNGNQGYGWGNANANARGGVGIQNRLARLDARIDAGVRNGSISRSEERSLRQELSMLARLERQYSRNGLSRREQEDLRMRVQSFRQNLQIASNGGYGDDRYGNDRYGNDRGRDRDDRRDGDRWGSRYPDDRGYGQGGPYEPVCYDHDRRSRGGGGLGGIIDSIFGGDDRDENCETGLRVGQRVSGNLGAVPYHLRSRFRDGGGVYYRSDGRSIYQIDARTQTVIRIYNVD